MIFPKEEISNLNCSGLLQDWMPTLYRASGGSPSDLGGIDGMDMWDALLRNRYITNTKTNTNTNTNTEWTSGTLCSGTGELYHLISP